MADVKLQKWLRHKVDGTIYAWEERMAANPSVEEVVAYDVDQARKNPSVAEIATLTPERLIIMTKWQLMAFAWVRLGTSFNVSQTRDAMLKTICDKLGMDTPQLELSPKEKEMAEALKEVPTAPVVPPAAADEPAPPVPDEPGPVDADASPTALSKKDLDEAAIQVLDGTVTLDDASAGLAVARGVNVEEVKASLGALVDSMKQQ